MRTSRNLLWAVLAAAIFAGRVGAVEVSLEENKVAKGSVGFVDMRLLFKLFPETQRAKQSFEEAVRQSEEQINLRRAELIGLRGEISRLKAERDFAVRSSSAPLVNLAPGAPANPAVAPNIPGMAEVAPSSSTSRPASRSGPAGVSPGPPPASVAVSSAAAPSTSASALTAHIADLDRTIADKSKALETKEADFKAFESQAEKSLLDLEGRKTEVLLGRIYSAIQDVAKNEGLSIVVDKSQILFGHKAVDLTDKVIQKLKSENQ